MENNIQTSTTGKKDKLTTYKIIAVILIFFIGCGGSFYLGTKFSKGKGQAGNDPGFQAMGSAGGFGGGSRGDMRGERPNLGTVTAVSSSSITIKDSMSGDSSTFQIIDSAKVMSDGSTGSASDIKIGDSVMIQTSSSDSKDAIRIMLNSGMPDGGNSSNIGY